MWMRRPVVAGRFYPGGRDELRAFVREASRAEGPKVRAVGVVSPHAGYMYSGKVAGKVFGAVEVPDTVLLLGPNHTGYGQKAAIVSEGSWSTPLGDVDVDRDLASALKARCPLLREDRDAHEYEHSLEVQLPFLQHANSKARIVPVALALRSASDIEEAGRAVGEAVKGLGRPVLLVASSDMTHYEPAASARAKDQLAIERVLNLDPAGLLDTVGQNRISMCGVVPTAVMLHAARELGATAGKLVAYAHSGEVSGDDGSVVGYAGLMVL